MYDCPTSCHCLSSDGWFKISSSPFPPMWRLFHCGLIPVSLTSSDRGPLAFQNTYFHDLANWDNKLFVRCPLLIGWLFSVPWHLFGRRCGPNIYSTSLNCFLAAASLIFSSKVTKTLSNYTYTNKQLQKYILKPKWIFHLNLHTNKTGTEE